MTVNIYEMAQTWNEGATVFTAIKMNVTDTASNANSLLIDLQVGGVSKFNVLKSGEVQVGANGTINSTSVTDSWYGVAFKALGGAVIGSFGYFSGASSLNIVGTSSRLNFNSDLYLYRDAANTIGQRNSTTAQTFNLYNTYTDGSNYERGAFKFDTNRLVIDTEEAGTGTARGITIGGADLILSSLPSADPVVAGQLWNNSGVLSVSTGV